MVEINRRNLQRRRKLSSSLSSFVTIRRLRLVILFFVAIQVMRMMGNFLTSNKNDDHHQGSTTSSQDIPKGLEQQLQESIMSTNRKVRSRNSYDSERNKNKEIKHNDDDDDHSDAIPVQHVHEVQTAPVRDMNGDSDGIKRKYHERGEKLKKKNEGDHHKPSDLNPIVLGKKGTGPTKVGYVKDFIDERNKPVYRTLSTYVTDASQTVASLLNEKSVRPCRMSLSSNDPKCSDPDTPLIAYNPASFTRTWCGQVIQPKNAVVMTEHCNDTVVHLFPAEVPPITGDHMPPIIIKSDVDKELHESDVEKVECDIPCKQQKGLIFGKGRRFIDGEPWEIVQTLDKVAIERTAFLNDRYYSSQSLLSSVPLANYDAKLHSLVNKKSVDFESAKEKAVYLVDSDCKGGLSKRDRWFDGVKKRTPVDSYGHCGHNIEVPDGMTIDTPEGRIELMKQYRIVLALDNNKDKDYISSMIWEAYASGAVPVIVGADNLRERLPPLSFINANDYNAWDELSKRVHDVITNKKLWDSHHEWRKDEKYALNLDSRYEFTKIDPTCRLCRWAYAKRYGLGWDHTRQMVRSIPKLPKEKFCVTADHGLISKPFVEQWVVKSEEKETTRREDSDGESCSFLSSDGAFDIDSYKGHRKAIQHDGVTDIIITKSNNDDPISNVILRLRFPSVRNPEGACFYDTHTLVPTTRAAIVTSASIQDNAVKVTVVADWTTSIECTGEGIMEILIDNGSENIVDNNTPAKRMRVIIEEKSAIHDKMTEFLPSSYSNHMLKDFIDPLEVFFVDS